MRCHTKLHKAHKPYLQLYPFHALTFTESTARTTREEEPQLATSLHAPLGPDHASDTATPANHEHMLSKA